MWVKTLYSLLGFLVLAGCWFRSTLPPPDWVLAPYTAYPLDQYLVGMGEGQSRDQADKRAYAAVARIFSARVQAKSLDRESYSLKETNELSTTQRKLNIDHMTQVTTQKLLENVKVLESWYRKTDQQFFVLAGLDRQQAEKVMLERLRDLDLKIEGFVTQGRTHPQKIQRIRGYKQALTLLHQRTEVTKDLRVIRASGEGVPSPYPTHQLQSELMDFVANHVVISLAIDGESQKELERAIWEGLTREGLLASAREPEPSMAEIQADLSISGTGRLWTVELPDPLFHYVRWCGDIQIRETDSDRLVGVISRSGREGHITEKEARVRASNTMQEVVAQEVARILTHSMFSDEPEPSNGRIVPKACPQ